jgi:predicted PurR-regulated permease PerM
MTPADGTVAEAWVRAIMRALWRTALYVAIIVGAAYAAGRLRAIIISLFIAGVIAYIMRPMAGWLARRPAFGDVHDAVLNVLAGLSRPFAQVALRIRGWVTHTPVVWAPRPIRLSTHGRRVFATFYVLIVLFAGGWYAVRFTFTPFVAEVKNVTDNWDLYQNRFAQYAEEINAWYVGHVKPEWRKWVKDQVRQNSPGGDLKTQATAWFGAGLKRIGEWAHYVIEIVLLPVMAFYFALDSRMLKHEFVAVVPRRRQRAVLRAVRDFNGIMYSFVVGQALLCLIAGVVVGVGLLLLGVKYPLTLGILAGLTRAIPVIGPIIGGIPIVILALVTRGVGVAVGVLVFFTFLHFAESKFIMPLLIGERMKLHPVVIIVVLLVGQEFGGLLGMFFAAPVAALLRVLVRRYWLRRHDRSHPHGGAPAKPETLPARGGVGVG